MGSLSPESLGFFNGPDFMKGKGGSIAVGGAAAAIVGGIAGAIGLGLAIDGMLNP